MILLSDNDIVEKLAQCELLDEFIDAYGVQRDEILVLPTLRSRMRSKKNRERLGEFVADQILAFVETVKLVSEYSNGPGTK